MMPNAQSVQASAKRLGSASKFALRVLPVLAFILAPFFLIQAPTRVLSRTCEEPQTKRAAVIGVMLWLAIAYIALRMVGVA